MLWYMQSAHPMRVVVERQRSNGQTREKHTGNEENGSPLLCSSEAVVQLPVASTIDQAEGSAEKHAAEIERQALKTLQHQNVNTGIDLSVP